MAGVVKVIFYETVIGGQDTVATISYDGKKYTCAGDKNLLGAFPPETESPETIYEVMQSAPAKYDGRMLRAEYIDSTKGGEGSGHYGHTGLPGVWGGSRSTGRADGTTDDSKPTSVQAAAKSARAEAEKAEPDITKIVTGVVEEYDGEMYKLDCRLKEMESIERRLNDLMEKEGRDLDGALEYLTDAVRYTMVLEDGVYVDAAKATIQTLEDQGWTEYKDFFENYWECGFGFEGYICVFTKGDQRFELQFHTPSAIKILAKSHKLYEKSRLLDDGPEKSKLVTQMLVLWDTVPSPPGWETLRGKLIGR